VGGVNGVLPALAVVFLQLSLLAFGGGNSILPEMQRQFVDVHQWLTVQDFTAMYALAQAAPGPNMMIAPLLGWRVGGLAGAGVVSLCVFGPSSILAAIVLRLWKRFQHAAWRPKVQAGLAPVTIGLVGTSAALITRGAAHTWLLAAVTTACALLLLRTRVHPLLLLAAGAAIGLTGFGQ
jgi:chromate transporter